MIRYQFYFLLCFFIFVLINCFQDLQQRNGDESLIDLSTIPWEEQSPFHLTDGWDFYWMKLLDPKDFLDKKNLPSPTKKAPFRPWTTQKVNGKYLPASGYATYHMKLKVQKGNEEKRFGIFYAHLFSASKLYINGHLLHEIGKVSSDLDKMVPVRLNAMEEITTSDEYLDIVLQISNRDFFRGGPRGQFLLGSPERIHLYQLQSIMVEIFVFGLIFGAFVYHLAFYFLNRNHIVFFYFSLLCLTFLIRIPFLNSKLYLFLFPVFLFDTLTNTMHYINIFSLLAGNQFLAHLFPGRRIKYFNEVFLVGGAVAFLSPLFPGNFKYFFNLAYMILYVILFFIHSIVLLYFNRDQKRSHYLMGIGLFGLSVFCFIAIFLNYFGIQGGIYLITGYAIYVVFQSISLSKYFAYAIENRAKIELQIQEKSLRALSKQRSEMQLMVHDNLGAGLTDLKVILDRKIRESEEDSNGFFSDLRGRLNGILVSLRSNLLELEDLNLINETFLTGMNITLLRRYSDVGRELQFEYSDSLVNYFQNLKLSIQNQDFFTNLYYIFYELCTNDLKYGTGESIWNLGLENHTLVCRQTNLVTENQSILSLHLKTVTNRIIKYRGKISSGIQNQNFYVDLQVPLPGWLGNS